MQKMPFFRQAFMINQAYPFASVYYNKGSARIDHKDFETFNLKNSKKLLSRNVFKLKNVDFRSK